MSEVQGLKVVLVLATSSGGVGRHVRSIAEGLIERGDRVVVCGPLSTEETFDFTGTGARFAAVEISDRPKPVGDLKAIGRLRALIKDADVVHAHGLRAGGLAALARLGSRPVARRGLPQAGGSDVRPALPLEGGSLAGGGLSEARGSGVGHGLAQDGGLVAGRSGVRPELSQEGGSAVQGRFAGRGGRGRGVRARIAGPPLVVTLHNAVLAGGAIGAAYAVLERVVARGADCALGVSPDLEERMRALGARRVGHALVPSPPFAAVPGDSVREELREELAAGERALVLTVARLADQKGLPDLLEAASALRKQQVLFVVVGDGPLDGVLRTRIAADDLPVRLLGRRSDIPALLAASDLVVVPSVWEGQPLFVQEALNAGKPLIATRVGGIPDLVGDAALLVPVNDPSALWEAIARVLEDPALAVSLAELSAERAGALPSEDEAVGQLADLYRDLSDS